MSNKKYLIVEKFKNSIFKNKAIVNVHVHKCIIKREICKKVLPFLCLGRGSGVGSPGSGGLVGPGVRRAA